MSLVYDNARVSVEMMTGGHVRPREAVPDIVQIIESCSQCPLKRHSRQVQDELGL